MKKLILLVAVMAGITFLMSFNENIKENEKVEINSIDDDYCDGWEEGYCEGWKDVKGQYSVCPVAPVCPVPEVGKDDYKGGYNRGFKKGMSAAKKS